MGPSVNPSSDLSLHAAGDAGDVALCAAVTMPISTTAPDWVHLLPAPGQIFTFDGRGPYAARDMAALAASSLKDGERLVIDENHATDLAAPQGQPAPARGWIVALEARKDGLWGQVEWTQEGRELVAGKAYRALSPVIRHAKDGTIAALLRASLVNRPNLQGLKTLHSSGSGPGQPHQEKTMDFIAKLAAKLGLEAGASEDAILAALEKKIGDGTKATEVAAQAALKPIRDALGLKDDATAETVLGAVKTAKAGTAGDAVTALQAQVSELTTTLNTERDARKRKDAEAFVDGAIAAGTVNVKPLRDHYVTRHMADPEGVEKEINAFPKLGPSPARKEPPKKGADGAVELNAEQSNAAKLLGVDPKAMAKTLADEAAAADAAL